MKPNLPKLGLTIASLLGLILVHGQQTELSRVSSDVNHVFTTLPTFFQKENVQGSPYLVDGWLPGNVELVGRRRIPEPGQQLFFNFDKMNDRVYVTDGIGRVWNYPRDSVTSFSLADSNVVLSFEKISLINKSRFLQVLVRSEKGYSLYCQWITKLNRSDFRNGGYYTTGNKFDEYVDLYKYFIVYPGSKKFKRLDLRVHAIKRAFQAESGRVNAFFSQKSGAVDVNTVILLTRFLNERNGY
jgi:hypothetical protein